MIFGGALTLILVTLFLILFNPQAGILLLQVIKPITNATWRYDMFGIRITEIVGAAVPIVVLAQMLFSKSGRLRDLPLARLWFIYLFINLLSVAMILASGRWLSALKAFLLIFNGFVGFFMFQYFFRDKESFRKLLIVLILAGLFPILTTSYMAVTETVWQVRHVTGDILRSVGMYHNVFIVRSAAFVTIAAILLSGIYFDIRSFYIKLLLILYTLLCFFIIFKAYSKAGFLILGLWIVIWTVMNKKFVWLLVVILAVLALNFAGGNKIYKGVAITFSKETAAILGTGETKYIMAGRLGVWEYHLDDWKQSDAFRKVFGAGVTGGTAHNDYLRVLMGGGVLGLFIYIILLTVIGWKVLTALIREKTPLGIMALMFFVMWLVDSIGLTPSIYPGYQWYVWGFIGLALRGVKDLTEEDV